MPLIFILLLLAPLLDIYLLLHWLFSSPLAAVLYWAATAALGAFMLHFAKIGFGEAMARLRRGRAAAAMFGGFAAVWFAGALLVFPGYISDIAALLVLVLPLFIRRPPPEDEERPLEVEAEITAPDERKD